MSKNDPNGRTALYRLLAANGRLLYVGIAANPDSRWGQHSTNQQWWNDVADRKIEWFPTRAAAATAEVAAIKAERPLHNIQHAVVDKPVIPAQTNSVERPLPSKDAEVARGTVQADHDAYERVPPQDLAAEQRVLGGMLLSREAIADVIGVLDPTDYYRPAHELIHGAIVDLDGRGDPADAITVATELVKRGEITRIGGPSYLRTLVNSAPTAANAEYYAEIVRERAMMRRLVEAGTRIVQMGYITEGDVDEIVRAARAEIWAVGE